MIFLGVPQSSLSPLPPLTFFKKINVPLVGGEATEHVGPKILFLAPIGAEISQVRFCSKKFHNSEHNAKKAAGILDHLVFNRDLQCVHNRRRIGTELCSGENLQTTAEF